MNSFEEKVSFPDELLDGMIVVNLLVNPANRLQGVAALSGKENGTYILRLYLLIKGENEIFFPTHELAAYSFVDKANLKDFAKRLPSMSAIELLIATNPVPVMPH